MMTLTSPESSFEVTEMEERDAIRLLLKASCLKSPTLDVQIQASKIVKELFCFPLAIDQAGAYIASGATTIGDYLAKYSEHQKTLLRHSEFTGASKYNRTVYETWELSYMEIQQLATVIHHLVLHQKLKAHLKHDGDTFSLKNCTFNLSDLHSLCPPNFRALGFVSVEKFWKYRCNIQWWEVVCQIPNFEQITAYSILILCTQTLTWGENIYRSSR